MGAAADRSIEDFTRTRWSMVNRLRGPQVDDARSALTEPAVRYWYPVYAYVRRCGHSQEIAQDFTQAFRQQIAIDLRGQAGARPGWFRELVRDELTDMVASADALAAEQQVLFAALDRSH